MKTKLWQELWYDGDSECTCAMNVPGGVLVRHEDYTDGQTQTMVFVPGAKVVTEDGVPVLIPARLA